MAESRAKKAETVPMAFETPPEVDYFVKRIKSGKRGSDHLYVMLLGMKEAETNSLLRQIEKGLSFRVFEHLRKNMILTFNELADLAGINHRTLNRRKKLGRLEPDESDRIVRVGRVFGRTLELFEGNHSSARHWFMSPQKALGNKKPSELAKTEFGAREVERLIGRLEYGVFT
jgi:putative toxin-antitoxin system antitoxin component (TIGR02293 family)